MGAGAFTGCKRLSKLHVRDMGQEKSCLREVLVDLNQTVTVEWLGKDGFQVLYPAFFEEAVENTPARIIEKMCIRDRIIAGAEGDGGQTCGNDSGRCEKRCFPVYRGRVKHLPF